MGSIRTTISRATALYAILRSQTSKAIGMLMLVRQSGSKYLYQLDNQGLKLGGADCSIEFRGPGNKVIQACSRVLKRGARYAQELHLSFMGPYWPAVARSLLLSLCPGCSGLFKHGYCQTHK